MSKTSNTTKRGYLRSLKEALGYSFAYAPKESFLICAYYILFAGLPYATAWFLGSLINAIQIAAETQTIDKSGIILLFVAYAVVNALPELISSMRMYVEKIWFFKFQTELELLTLKKRSEIDIAHYEDPAFQDLYQRAFQRSFWPLLEMVDIQFEIINGLTAIAIGTVLAATFSWKIYLILFITSVPKFIAQFRYGNNIWSIWAIDTPEQRRFSDLRQYFIGRTHIVETKLIQSANYLLAWIRRILVKFNNDQMRAEKSKMLQLIFAEAFALIGFVLAAFLILQDVLAGSILVGSMVYMLSTLSNVRNSFASTFASVARQNERYLIARDILKFLDTEPRITNAAHPVKLDIDKAPEIVFENIGFKYANSQKNVLENVNLTILSGSKVGLVGNNGAGKTTLIKLLCRIYDPTEGRILINGTDLRDIELKVWWSYLGVMLQDYVSYDFPVKDAIGIGRSNKDIDIEEVKKAAEISQASEFIERWKFKYDNPMGVEFGGEEPSKGQRQKLSIAKIIYRNALVTILDEPTASVDAESEAKIFDSLESLSENMTAILISHDFSTISQCNQIIVMEEGKVKETGTHDELIENNSTYAELYNLQAKRFK